MAKDYGQLQDLVLKKRLALLGTLPQDLPALQIGRINSPRAGLVSTDATLGPTEIPPSTYFEDAMACLNGDSSS